MLNNSALQLMCFMKESVCSFAGANGYKLPNNTQERKNDHGYYMNVSEPSNEQEEDESDTE